MKIVYWKLLLVIVVLCSSCEKELDEPNYSEIPIIELRNVKWVRIEEGNGSLVDIIQIEIGWQDGDGDLGMNAREVFTNTDFQPFHLVRDEHDRIQYFNSTTDTFSCSKYIAASPDRPIEIDNDIIEDTVRVIHNKYRGNFHVAILYKRQGEFVEYDFLKEDCRTPIKGLFPPIDSLAHEKVTYDDGGPFVIYQESPWSGTITFTVSSYLSNKIFSSNSLSQDTLKIRVQINDRALHDSNIVESEPFTIEETDW
ncbi:MAG: hypothetical protein RIG62_22635 [Cyclobacteriaceae bacterium]